MKDVEAAIAAKLVDTWEPLPMRPCGWHQHWKPECPVCAPEFDDSRYLQMDSLVNRGLPWDGPCQ